MRTARRSAVAPVWALIAGGGTGGHVLPAIAIARALVAAGHPSESIRFVGSRRGMERTLVPAAGFEVTLLPGRGIARRVSMDNVGAALGTVVAVVRATVVMARRRPAVVVSVGGYASVPCVVGAAVLGVPLIVVEQNAVPGLANRLAGRVAKAAAVAFPGTPLRHAVVTGNPVRAEMFAVDRSATARRAARRELGLPEESTVIAVVGGSLGARTINTAAVALAARWAQRPGLVLYHVVGERDADAMAAERRRAGEAVGAERLRAGEDVGGPSAAGGTEGLVYRQVRFEARMDRLYAAADVTVQRAGAGTVAELAAAGVPAVLVPLPGAPGDHQTANARGLEAVGAAVIVPDADLDADRLAGVLDMLLGDPDRLDAMGLAARRAARPAAAADVAALAERWARG